MIIRNNRVFLEGSKPELNTQVLRTDNTMVYDLIIKKPEQNFLPKNKYKKILRNLPITQQKHNNREKIMEYPMITWGPNEEEKGSGDINIEESNEKVKVIQSFKSDYGETRIKDSSLKNYKRGREEERK